MNRVFIINSCLSWVQDNIEIVMTVEVYKEVYNQFKEYLMIQDFDTN